MKPFKFIHAADLHLDSRFKGVTDIPQSIKDELIQSSFQTFAKIIDYAIQEQVSFIVISGDLYDAEQRSLHAQLFLHQQFDRLKPYHIQVFIIHGNHDPLTYTQSVFQFSEHVHVFSSDAVTMQPAYQQDELVAYVYGISYGSKSVYDNLAKYYVKQQKEGFHLALYHGTIGSSSEHEPYAPCSVQDWLTQDFDYVALGHIHKPQVFVEKMPIVYAGNIQGRHRNEAGERGCYLVEVNEHKQTALRFVPLAVIQWETIEIDCTDIEVEQQLVEVIQNTIHHTCTKAEQNYMVHLRLVGTTSLHQQLTLPAKQIDLVEAIRSVFPIVQPWIFVGKLSIDTMMSYDKAKLINEDTFLQQLIENVNQLKLLSVEDMMKIGHINELWQHYELSRQLPQIQHSLVEGALDEAVKSILDFVAEEKGRES